MDRKAASLKHHLAVFACSVLCAFATGAAATTSQLSTNGVFSYAVSGNNVTLTVGTVQNVTQPPRISGELFLELWAFPVPFFGLAQGGYQQQGYRLGSHALGRLAPDALFLNVISQPVAYTPPPPGTWYVSSLIVEYDAAVANANGLSPRAFFNYAAPLVVAAPVTITPTSGFWWDTAQIGTGYSIHVRHGIAVVVVYSYRPDGTAVWYLSSGALTNGGRSYTGTLDTYAGGPCISCTELRSPTPTGNAGTIAIEFSGPNAATVYLPGGRVAHIVPADY